MFKKFKVISVLILLLATTSLVKAQVDTLFWFAAPWITPDHDQNTPMAFHFSTFNNPTTIRLRQPSGTYDTTFSVGANSLFSKYVSHIVNEVESKPADNLLTSGFEITSDYPIVVVYDFISSPNGGSSNNPETYSLKGQNGLGYEFVVPFQTLWNNKTLGTDRNGDGQITQPKQQFTVVAAEDNTTIWITPKCDVVGGHPANVTYSVTLPFKGNSYTCENLVQTTSSVPGSSLAGSIVVSDKKVAVTGSDDSVNPSGGGGCFDLLGDQIVPVDVIGQEYNVNKGFLNTGSDESIFVVATENFTTVTIDDGTVSTVILNQGDTYQYSITQQLTNVKSDKNVYVMHMSGYGCELGSAILPPVNCAGSDQVTFPRTNGQSFLLDIICPAGAEGNFTLNGSTTLITAGMFNPVPGTANTVMGAQISFNTTDIPVGSANIINNSSDLFSLGIINGGASTGCLYHYVSSFIRRVYVDAGNDTTLCNGEPSVALVGSVEGGATTGEWTVLNGTGILNTPTNLTTTYLPTVSDYNQGELTFVLASTGNCNPVYDTLKVSFIQSPNVSAGSDDTYCKNNLTSIPISGTLSYAAGATWSGGNGGAFGNSGSLTTTYTPSPTDLANDSVVLYLTSAGSFFACPNDEDTVVVRFTEPPVVSAGADQSVCSSVQSISLNGSVSGPTSSGIWTTSGTGAFDPTNTDVSTGYLLSSGDTTAGSVVLTLTSTSNGNCLAVQDSLTVTILDKPEIAITMSDSICSNLTTMNLTGTVSTGFSTTWNVLGSGVVASPSSLNTIYSISPVDTTTGYLDVLFQTTGAICPVEQDSIRVIFINPPAVNAGLDQSFCNNEPVGLNGTITGTSPAGIWTSTGTGLFNPSANLLSTYYYPSSNDVANGSVALILTSTNNYGCAASDDTLNVTFKAAPIADFTFNVACAGDNTNFIDASTTTDGTISSWLYDFGDLSTSIADNPIHPYQASGSYSVTMIVGGSNGCYDTIVQNVDVNPVPFVDFEALIPCEGTETQFNDLSTISGGSIVSWDWIFDNGQGTSSIQNPAYTFNASGFYQVSLTVESDLGCQVTNTEFVEVHANPNAAFTMNPNPALALEDVSFTDESTGTSTITNWYWNFGDENGGNNQNEIHNYADGGEYIVELLITDINGCVDTTSQVISIALLPVLPTAFTPNMDGQNDVFIIRGGPFNAVDFKVYNNWGELIFKSNDETIGWDGTYKGQSAPLGVYTWVFEVEIADGRIIKKSGDVTLMR